MNKHMGNQAFQAVGVSEAAIKQALDYTTTTIRWEHPLIEYQGVHFPIADMWVNAEAARAIEREEGWPLELMYRDAMVFQLYRTPNIDRKFLASYLVRRRL